MALYALIILLAAVGLTGMAALALVVFMVIRTSKENAARIELEAPIRTATDVEPPDVESIASDPDHDDDDERTMPVTDPVASPTSASRNEPKSDEPESGRDDETEKIDGL